MKTEILYGEAMVGKTVVLTVREMTQMSEVLNNIKEVINNHQKKDEKKIYLTDDDLYKLEAIFMCILESDSDIAETCFDRYEKQAHKARTGADHDIDK